MNRKETDELLLLSETTEAYIARCKCCSKVNLVYKNIALKLTMEEFCVFKRYFDQLNPEHFLLESYTGKNIFVSSPVSNLVFCFSKQEVAELQNMMNEASLMLEVYEILK